jgi:hypothetical protein
MNSGHPRWGRLVLEEVVLPQMPRLQRVALSEYDWMLRRWRKHPAQVSPRFDADRFTLLKELIDARLQMLLYGANRRMLFNTARSFQPDELRWLLGAPDPERKLITQLTVMSTRAIIWHAERQDVRRLPGRAGIRLTEGELSWVRDELPEKLARLLALCALAIQAQTAFRGAGKGLRLVLDPAGRPAEQVLGSLDADCGWAWEPDQELMRALAEYDERRWRTDESVTGMPAPQTFGRGSLVWAAAGIYDLPLTVTYPDGREHTTHHFMVHPIDISARLEHFVDIDAQFTEAFGLSADAFGRICRSLAGSVFRLAAVDALDLGPERGGRQRARCRLRPDDPRLEMAPTYLHEVLAEGSLRAARAMWFDTLSRTYYGDQEPADPAAIEAFLTAFTSSPDNDPLMLRPVLFHELEPDILLLDLALAAGFADLCYHALITGPGFDDGTNRGKRLEKYARQVICAKLGLVPPFPVPPGYKLAKAGLDDGEVDFCFLRGTVLVNIDMKSFRRNLAYHDGVNQAVRNRISKVTRQLREQVEPRGEQLRHLLEQRGHQVEAVVNMLCVADVEYVPPGPQLRYGQTPRVLTAEEIASLIADPVRWAAVVRSAHTAKEDR